MKLKVLVKFANEDGFLNNGNATIVSVVGIDKSECYRKAHQRCMDIADEIDKGSSTIYLWLAEKWE